MPAFLAGTLYPLYPESLLVSELVFLTSSPPFNVTLIPTFSWTVSARLSYWSNEETSKI